MKKGCLVYGMEMGVGIEVGGGFESGRLSLWISCLGVVRLEG